MTRDDEYSLLEKRQILRGELIAQREVIAEQLDPTSKANTVYPRSMTMRFLTEHSTLAGGVLAGVATLLIGARYYKSIAGALTMFKVVRSVASRLR